MQAIAVGCDYNDKTPYSVDIVNKVWSLVLANSAPGDAICVLDFEGHGARFEALSRSHGEQRDVTFIDGDRQLYRRRWNSLEKTFADQHYKYVIILSHPRDYHYIVRYVNYHFVGEPTPVLPFVSTGGANPTTVELGMADPAPIIGMGFPGAGSDRLMPVFRALMDMYSIEQHYYVSPISNRRYIRRRADPDFRRGGPIPDGRMFDADVTHDYYQGIISNLDYHTWIDIHVLLSSHFLGQMPDTKVVYLYRDPRDYLTTCCLRAVNDAVENGIGLGSADKEETYLRLLDGFDYILPQRDNFQRGMSLTEIVESFRGIQDYDNIYGIRFEDIRYRPRETYRDMLAWLGLDQVNLVPISDDALDRIIELGTFSHQSKGKYVEGKEDAVSIYNDGSASVNTSMRKGIKGDWKNHFTPRVADRFKEIAGETLIKIGYESDMNW
ncbi:MAG: sulfotransferase domain-containing protein [Alphaproteobacteria bacterium]|jgi:hypothetical protein|nr:sulfotransferase domain-containing protein [Alphaproteobacteria bacterium]